MSSVVHFDQELGAPFIQKCEPDKEYFSSFRLFCFSWLFKNFQLEFYLFLFFNLLLFCNFIFIKSKIKVKM